MSKIDQAERERINAIRMAHYASLENGDAAEPSDEADAIRARLTRLGVKFHHKAGEPKLRELLNAALDDTTDGLSRRELCADLENLAVAFDPDAPRADLIAAIEAATAPA